MRILQENKQKIVLAVGFLAVASLGYFAGQSIKKEPATNSAKSSVSSSNYNQENKTVQPSPQVEAAVDATAGPLNCDGKIKGSSSMIYHMPDGAFYKRVTNPIRCFDTEAEAQAAGFRKSSK